MELGKQLRMRRVLRGGRAVIVPMDHPIYSGAVEGLEDPRDVVRKVAEGGADGLLITPGALETAASVLGDLSIVLRLDGTHTKLGKHLERIDLIGTVEHAARLGVDAVVVNVFIGTDNEDVLLGKLARVACGCREWGMPLVAEMIPEPVLAAHYGKSAGDLTPDKRAEYIALASRVGAEVGADIIKTNYTGTRESFERVTRAAMRPVLMAGGPKTGDDASLLASIRDAMDAGAAGVCVGRNLWQRKDVVAMTRAIRAIVHDGASVAEAAKLAGIK